MGRDWIFRDEGTVCNFRVAGVVLQDGKLLVQQEISSGEYALPGGHVSFREASADTLVREFREELGAKVRPIRLLWSEECFWHWSNRDAHSLCFYYLAELESELSLPAVSRDNPDVLFRWLPVENIPSVTLWPPFAAEELQNLSPYPKHFVRYE